MLYIITPVYNRIEFTKNYLAALSKQSVQDFKVIIVDDGSTDGTSEMIKEYFSDVILLQGDGNLWWAEATNVGVRYALKSEAKYIMTLNDDTLPTVDFIEKMLYWTKKRPKALLGAFAIDAINGRSVYGGEIRSWSPSEKNRFLLNELPLDDQHGLHRVNIFPGRGLLIPAEVFQKVGLYDSKNFPQTYADYDFTARAINARYQIFCNYDARIKIFPDEGGGMLLRKKKSIKNYYLHLFGKRGGGNLKWFIIFAIKNAPKKYLLTYTIYGVVARIFGYLKEWILEVNTKRSYENNN